MAVAVKKAQFAELVAEAEAAGIAAVKGTVPTPMVVSQQENPMAEVLGGDPGEVEYAWLVPDGVCGFAWVNVKPGTSSFARYLKAEGVGRTDGYYGGVTVWITQFGQSYERKMAYATAYAAVLREAGIKAYADGRLD